MRLDVYQARSGHLFIRNGSKATRLTKAQIKDLHISPFELDDFDLDDYRRAYGEDVAEDDPDEFFPTPGAPVIWEE